MLDALWTTPSHAPKPCQCTDNGRYGAAQLIAAKLQEADRSQVPASHAQTVSNAATGPFPDQYHTSAPYTSNNKSTHSDSEFIHARLPEPCQRTDGGWDRTAQLIVVQDQVPVPSSGRIHKVPWLLRPTSILLPRSTR